jgi:hypothetical protein
MSNPLVIKKEILKTISDLDLYRVFVQSINCDRYPNCIITITGGDIMGDFNWVFYLNQISRIVESLNYCELLDLVADNESHTWMLTLKYIDQ